jgi:sulfite reductase beta subunit-like hemoprotein
MYEYNEFDKAFLRSRAAQFRDQIERWQRGKLSEDAFRPLRLQNGWYVQRHAPMLRVAVPYGELSSAQLRVLARIAERYQDLDELNDIGEIDLHISGCITSCGQHHSGHIGILGVDKDGEEWYQVTLGGSDGSSSSGNAQPGKVIGPSLSAIEVLEVIDAVLASYLELRADVGSRSERFIETVRRAELDPFKAAANRVRADAGAAA